MKKILIISLLLAGISITHAADFRWEELYFRVFEDYVLAIGDFYFNDIAEDRGFMVIFPYAYEHGLFKPDSIRFSVNDSTLNADRRTHLIKVFIPPGEDHFRVWFTTPWEDAFQYILTSIYSWRHPLDSAFINITYPSDMEISISYPPDSLSMMGDSIIAHYQIYDFLPEGELEIRRERK